MTYDRLDRPCIIDERGKCNQSVEKKRKYGCESKCTGKPIRVRVSGNRVIVVRRCPRRLLHGTNVYAVLRAYAHYCKGHLPESKGTDYNTASLMDAFAVIEQESGRIRDEIQVEDQKKIEAEQRRKARSKGF